jgi:hypothetical protein
LIKCTGREPQRQLPHHEPIEQRLEMRGRDREKRGVEDKQVDEELRQGKILLAEG